MGRGGGAVDLVSTIEGIYEGLETVAPHTWLARVTGHVVALVGAGAGGLGHSYDLRGPRARWSISRPLVHDAPEELADVVSSSFAATPSENLRAWYGLPGPAGTFSALTGMTLADLPGAGESSRRLRIFDQVYVNAGNPDVEGVLIVANLRTPRSLSRVEVRRLSMVAAHVAAGQRILRALARGRAAPVAIFERDGRVAHTEAGHEGAVRSLRARVVAVDRVRGAMRRTDPERALVAWRALLAGRYSTLDRFDTDGRRYVVAYQNAPNVLDPRGLSAQEAIVASWAARGHPDKVIAYELGIAAGTVSALLARAYKKLGVRTRAELVMLLEPPTRVDSVALDDDTDVLVFAGPREHPAALAALTGAERAVAEAAARGARTARIARERGVSTDTVEKQLARVYAKLGVRSRAELARLFA
ncbi:MAG: LuxR C-terminal-related transcriptional regulator [Polyangiaceae bacterium]